MTPARKSTYECFGGTHGTSEQVSVDADIESSLVTTMILSASFIISPTIPELMYLYGMSIENYSS